MSLRYFATQGPESTPWADAQPLDALGPALKRGIGPGEALLVGFPPDGEAPFFWRETLARVNAQGTSESPARLAFGRMEASGDLAPPRAADAPCLRMSRADFPSRNGPDPYGKPFMVLQDPRHLAISGPGFEGSGAKGFFRLTGRGEGLALSDLHARMAGRAIETEKGSAFENVELRRSSGYGLIRGFARFHDLSNARFLDLDLDAADIDGGGTRVCQLISIVAGRNLRFERVHLRRAVNLLNAEARGSSYVQGDGVVLEEETSDAQFTDCHARDFGDAGFDMKCAGVRFLRCSVRRCKYGVRIWRDSAENLLDMCVISEPVFRPKNAAACLWLGGQVTLRNCALSTQENTAAIRFGRGPDTQTRVARMFGGSIDTRAGGQLLAGEPGRLELSEVMLDGNPVTAIAEWTGSRLVRG